MAVPGPNPLEALSKADQKKLLRDTQIFAARLLNRYAWRGRLRGVLAEGYQPSSLASEAVARLLTRRRRRRPTHRCVVPLPRRPRPALSNNGAARRHKILAQLKKECRRFVRHEISRLHYLRENVVVHNEPDLTCFTDEGEERNPIFFVASPCKTPLEELIEAEDEAEFHRLKNQFAAFLGPQRRLKTLLHYLCAGISRPARLARKLRLPTAAINTLKTALQSRFRAFSRSQKWQNLDNVT